MSHMETTTKRWLSKKESPNLILCRTSSFQNSKKQFPFVKKFIGWFFVSFGFHHYIVQPWELSSSSFSNQKNPTLHPSQVGHVPRLDEAELRNAVAHPPQKIPGKSWRNIPKNKQNGGVFFWGEYIYIYVYINMYVCIYKHIYIYIPICKAD